MAINPLVLFGALGAAGLALAMGGKKAHAAPAPGQLPAATPGVRPPSTPTYATEDPVEEYWEEDYYEEGPQAPAPITRVDPDLPASTQAPAPTGPVLSPELQDLIAKALAELTVDEFGNLTGPVTKKAVQGATLLVGRLRNEGFEQAAAELDGYAKRAATLIPLAPPEKEMPLPGLDSELQSRVNKALELERDPKKLLELLNVLSGLPQTPERDAAMAKLAALIKQLQAAVTPAPAPVAPEPATQTPALAPAPAPKLPGQLAGESMAKHLKSVQSRYGMPGAKGKEDKSIVVKFQTAAGITADGLAGPGTLAKAASLSVGNLPLVMYWPRGSSLAKVQQYRDTLRRLAGQADAQGHVELGNQLRMVANYEKGQAGVGQWGGPLS